MSSERKYATVVKKYFFEKDGKLEKQSYDWIGSEIYGRYPIELDGKLGFADLEGNIVIPIIYDKTKHVEYYNTTDGALYLCISKNHKYGIVSKDNEIITGFEWDLISICNTSEDLVAVCRNGKWGFVNIKTGKLQIAPVFDEVEHFCEGFACVKQREKWGMINTEGKAIVPIKYTAVTEFIDDFAIVFEDGWRDPLYSHPVVHNSKSSVVNKDGFEIIKKAEHIERYELNFFMVIKKVGCGYAKRLTKLIPMEDYIVIIENGEYHDGFLSIIDGHFEPVVSSDERGYFNYHTHAKYKKGGKITAVSHRGIPVHLTKTDIKEIVKKIT